MAKSWFFRGKTVQGQSLFGVFDNNHGDSCINIGGKILMGVMPLNEADPYITKNPRSHFVSSFKMEENNIQPFKKNIYFNISTEPDYIELSKWMSESELSSLSCSDAKYSRQIRSGQYQNSYPDSIGVQIRKNKYSVYYDDAAPEPWELTSKSGLQHIKPGVFYSSNIKRYYCSIDKATIKKRAQNSLLTCSYDGWVKYR